MSFQTILSLDTMKFERPENTNSGNVAVVTFTRPDAMNAMNQTFFDNFEKILQEISRPDSGIRALLMTGEGRGFCAGADLKEQAGELPPDLGDTLRRNYNPLIRGLKALPIPTVVAVNGVTAGAGMSLVAACDIAIAAKSSLFLQAFVNIALVPDAGSTFFLPRLVGRARATKMMMLGEKLSATDALDIGLISEVTEDDCLLEHALKIATKFANGPTKALVKIRHLLDQSDDNSLAEQMEAEAIAQQEAGHSADFAEGVGAFIAKRPAVFKGK